MADTADTAKARILFMGSIASEGIVVIEVGQLHKQYQVHKSLLIRHSDYFRKALAGPWKEAEDQRIDLDDMDPKVFALFTHWLFYQKFVQGEDESGKPIIDARGDEAEALEMCTKAYIFGDRFLAPGFRRAANNYLAEALPKTYLVMTSFIQDLTHAFENIPADRVIIQALVDEFCLGWNDKDTLIYGADAMSLLPPRILRRVAKRFQEKSTSEGSVKGSWRCYLEHESERETDRCGGLHMRWDEEKELGFFE